MKYVVTVQGMRIDSKTLTVEGATEKEASDSARDLVVRLYPEFNPSTVWTVSIEEAATPLPERSRGAYLKAVL